jgi:hypothetical protein
MKENELQKAILTLLSYHQIKHWRINTTGLFDPRTQTFRPSLSKGVSDIVGILPDGRFLAIEVKTKTGKVSQEQQVFLDAIRENNGVAIVARSIEDVAHVLEFKRCG